MNIQPTIRTGLAITLAGIMLPWVSYAYLSVDPNKIPGRKDAKANKSSVIVGRNISLYRKWLDSNNTTTSQWTKILQTQGDSYYRRSISEQILAMKPFPAEQLVSFLPHPELAVRLAAIELLEEHAGTAFEYDPWLPCGGPGNADAIAQWQLWLESGGTNEEIQVYSGLTQDDIQRLIREALSDGTPQRRARAIRQLAAGDLAVAAAIDSFINDEPALSREDRNTLRQIHYRILMPTTPFIDNVALAQRLTQGDADARARCYEKLALVGYSAVDILKCGLNDPNPIVREAAAEAIIDAGRKNALPTIQKHLETESDHDVIYAIVRSLGKVRTKNALQLLVDYFSHQEEDIVLIAIDSAGKLNSSKVTLALRPCLTDKRWRVRAAALQTLKKVTDEEMTAAVKACLSDEDEFVRYAAVKALPNVLSKKDCIAELTELFKARPELRIPVTESLATFDKPFPEELEELLFDDSPEQQMAIVQLLAKEKRENADLLLKLAESPDDDVASLALRSVAKRAEDDPNVWAVLLNALDTESVARRRSVLESFYPSSELRNRIQKDYQPTSSDDSQTPAPEDNGAMNELFDAFLAPEPVPETPTPEPAVTMNDLFDSFLTADDTKSESDLSASDDACTLQELREGFERCLDDPNKQLSRAALTALLTLDPARSQTLKPDDIKDFTDKQKASVTEALAAHSDPQAIETLTKLLRSHEQHVRKKAAEALLSDIHAKKGLMIILSELQRDNTLLQPADLPSYTFNQQVLIQRSRVTRWAEATLSPTNTCSDAARIYSIALIGAYGRDNNIPLIQPGLTSSNEYIRAASYYSLGMLDRHAFIEQMNSVIRDPSREVRLAAATLFNPKFERVLRFSSTDKTDLDEDVFTNRKRPRRKERPALIEQLHILEQDADPEVRLQAMLSLIANKAEVAPEMIQEALLRLPKDEREHAADIIAHTLDKHAAQLSPAYSSLLPTLRDADASSYAIKDIEKALAKKQRKTAHTRLNRTIAPAKEEQPEESVAATTLPIIYFYTPDCEECVVIDEWLSSWTNDFPKLQLHKHNIIDLSAQNLQRRYIESLQSDPAQEGITPFIVTAAGHLERDELTTPAQLRELLLNAQSIIDTNWMLAIEEAITPQPTATPTPQSEEQPLQTRRNPLITLTTIIVLLTLATLAIRRLKKRT